MHETFPSYSHTEARETNDGAHWQLRISAEEVYELLQAEASRCQLLQLSMMEEHTPKPTPASMEVERGGSGGVVTGLAILASHLACHSSMTSSKELSKVLDSMHCWTSPSQLRRSDIAR
ncbi:hypothetical protein MPH_00230 [Macrophomina phaseolina MS6]|uniref:Uncharacterized protein n=1 Tax=Macrophomina phaseolina (strain MS6) TaxID=1126212 RepID=K2T0S7_MACPH|nr:hypothetical protein MPH_00230 [Macrophomina phaseolina MS6]